MPLPAVPPAHSVRRAPNSVANELNRQELNRISGAYLCAAIPMVPAAVAVSLAVPADAVVSATDVVPAIPVVAAEPAS